jgi:hypothetical protein
MAASHGTSELSPVLVGPATGDEFNTVIAGIIPVACWRVDDIRFEFDSSFITPAAKPELAQLAALRKAHPESPLSVFGHADPIGDDIYNKTLSGRRATAIYGLLTRDTGLWEELFSQASGNDKWGAGALQTMHAEVNPPPPGSAAAAAPGSLQHNAGERKQLFSNYMDKLCGPELKLEKKDFLAQGADNGGKGDYQGCSEFNPVLIFSQQDHQRFQQANDKTERNAANAPNRRVMVLLFRKGSKVDPAKWPCPRAKEGIAGCKKRFWSDGESRRSRRLPDRARTFPETEDTFGCRFYHRLTTGSPCEEPPPPIARVIKIKATVPSTQPNTPRAAPPAVANLWPDPVDLSFESTKPLPTGALAFQDADFATPNALVVIRNGEGPIRLEAETVPAGAQLTFQAVRATDDAATLGAGVPTVTSTGPNTATLATNERGSFFVLAFVDRNGNGQHDPGEPGIILPVIMVEARIETAATELRSVANPANINIQFDTGGQAAPNYNFVSITTGDFNTNPTAGVALDADVLLVGGGPDGTRGLDRVFTGWANNFTALNYVGTYQDGSLVQRVQIDNRNQANGTAISGIPVFVTRPGAPAPNPIAYPPPLLDTGRQNPELGGENITFSRSAESAPVNQALGVKRTVIARDSPGWFHQRRHPDALKATQLASFVHSLNSTTYLVAWTNTTGGAAPTPGTANSLGFRTFTVIAETQWTVTAQFTVNRVGANFVLQQTGNAPTITATNVDHSAGVTPASVGMEVRPPETLQSRAIDAR